MERKEIDTLIQKLDRLSNEIYEGKESNGALKIGELIPELATISSWITDALIKEQLIKNSLNPLLLAMEENDNVYMADIISYELIDILNKIKKA